VDVVYLRYFRDLELVVGHAWGAAALAHLYKELNNAFHYNKKTYVRLLISVAYIKISMFVYSYVCLYCVYTYM